MSRIIPQATPIDMRREIARYNNVGTYWRSAGNKNGLQSALFDPISVPDNRYGNLRTADRNQNRNVSCKMLRRVASKAWIISICKLNIIRHVEPFLKPSTNKNIRGFTIRKKGEEISGRSYSKSKEIENLEHFLLNTGFVEDDDREDTFIKYCTKILNDMFDIDQIATEIQYTRSGKPCAFWAIDAATIEKVIPGQENPDGIKYVQVIDHIPYAFYTKDELIFDYQNARTELQYSFYGYSYVEQAIDLITSFINTFIYNSGYFTENKLPRGMLLIDGDASQETVEMMEDYIYDVMSGNPSSQWRIPIIPSGMKKEEGNNAIKFVPLNQTNKEMEYQSWFDLLISSVCALFGSSIDDLGLHSSKSQPMFEGNAKHKYDENRSRVLGNVLGYLQAYLNRIIAKVSPEYELEFVGYEKDNPEEILELDKGEIESYKTLNEKRQEKGLKKLEHEWADIPLNAHAVQLFQAAQGGGMAGMAGMEDTDEYSEDDNRGDYGNEDQPEKESVNAPPDKQEQNRDFGKSLRIII